eukprot:TRINITY_DN17976_c0_g1_i1.p1 TRINITY_DN17976_c0_g1~~TRINITY_DN17976_c0_g1_i1.p1  ORF type:complete len:206 (-),score=28.15 TRINITY_DN17976_c0_g1_i1:109-693(-)
MNPRDNVEREIISLIPQHNFKRIAEICEEYELESRSVPFYGVHLIVYLIQNNSINARFLWKRIPNEVKQSEPELAAIWKIGTHMWTRNYSEVYKSFVRYQWSHLHTPLIAALAEAFRNRTLQLISNAYSTISVVSAAELFGLSNEEAIKIAQANHWEYDPTSNSLKCNAVDTPKIQQTGIDQLGQLAGYVMFLE